MGYTTTYFFIEYSKSKKILSLMPTIKDISKLKKIWRIMDIFYRDFIRIFLSQPKYALNLNLVFTIKYSNLHWIWCFLMLWCWCFSLNSPQLVPLEGTVSWQIFKIFINLKAFFHLYIQEQKIGVNKVPDIRIKVLALKSINDYLKYILLYLF